MTQEMRTYKKGDIYYYDFGENPGSIQNGKRPALILQADNFNTKAPTIIVAAITSVNKKRYMPSHIDLGENFGLTKPSMALLEQIKAVNKDDLTDYIGHVDDEHVWKQINIAIKKTFGLWFNFNQRTSDIRCLCPNCLRDYMNDTSIIVRRVDPFKQEKEKCDKCNGFGYDYSIYDKRTVLGGRDNG